MYVYSAFPASTPQEANMIRVSVKAPTVLTSPPNTQTKGKVSHRLLELDEEHKRSFKLLKEILGALDNGDLENLENWIYR